MVIKEVEALTGMTRANVRFYEKEGLIAPARSDNGYRDYSEAEVEELRKIKLLRVLGLSLEDIRAAQSGQKELTDLMKKQMDTLEEERRKLETAAQVCDRLEKKGKGYDELDPAPYLAKMEGEQVPDTDAVSFQRREYWRLFARCFDLGLYYFIGIAVLVWGFHIQIGVQGNGRAAVLLCLESVIAVVLMLAVEPLMLSSWGTTPGKWLLGMGITGLDGEKLSYGEAARRTWQVVLHGMGLNIPFLNLYCLWRSDNKLMAGEELVWERDSVQHHRAKEGQTAKYFFRLAVAALAIAAGSTSLRTVQTDVVVHTPNLTVARFAENYNSLGGGEPALLEDGTDVNDGRREPLNLQYEVRDGRLAGVRMEVHRSGKDIEAYDFYTERGRMVRAFAGALEQYGAMGDKAGRVARRMEKEPFESLEEEVNGVRVSTRFTLSGLGPAYTIEEETPAQSGPIMPDGHSPLTEQMEKLTRHNRRAEEGTEAEFHMIFTMELTEQ